MVEAGTMAEAGAEGRHHSWRGTAAASRVISWQETGLELRRVTDSCSISADKM